MDVVERAVEPSDVVAHVIYLAVEGSRGLEGRVGNGEPPVEGIDANLLAWDPLAVPVCRETHAHAPSGGEREAPDCMYSVRHTGLYEQYVRALGQGNRIGRQGVGRDRSDVIALQT